MGQIERLNWQLPWTDSHNESVRFILSKSLTLLLTLLIAQGAILAPEADSPVIRNQSGRRAITVVRNSGALFAARAHNKIRLEVSGRRYASGAGMSRYMFAAAFVSFGQWLGADGSGFTAPESGSSSGRSPPSLL
jgi:hypothetical protein